jgi:hypothetical protein
VATVRKRSKVRGLHPVQVRNRHGEEETASIRAYY